LVAVTKYSMLELRQMAFEPSVPLLLLQPSLLLQLLIFV
jgi:hypothetical protein